jgi:hypothetical protein
MENRKIRSFNLSTVRAKLLSFAMQDIPLSPEERANALAGKFSLVFNEKGEFIDIPMVDARDSRRVASPRASRSGVTPLTGRAVPWRGAAAARPRRQAEEGPAERGR